MPRAVLMKRIWHFIKLPLTRMRIPVTESQRDTMLKQAPPRVSGKGDGFELMTFFDFRSATKFIEKTQICSINAFQFLLNCLARQCLPMWMRGWGDR